MNTIRPMYVLYNPVLCYICYTTIACFVLPHEYNQEYIKLTLLIQQSHEYSDWVGVHVLIQNRTTGPYAPKFTEVIMTMSCTGTTTY